ncbi:MAG: alanine racemase C-terminal domain-containing protein [Stenotrophomonas sp.]
MARACGYHRPRTARARGDAGRDRGRLPYRVEELAGNLAVAQAMAALARRAPARAAGAPGAEFGRHEPQRTGTGHRAGTARRAGAGRQPNGLRVVGLMTHFPSEDPDDVRAGVRPSSEQADWLFANTALRRGDVQLHAANSFALQHVPESRLDMVRPGGALYGYGGTPKPPFAHVAAFKTRVASVQAFPAGDTVSYDRTFTLQRDSLLANLPVGYSDGYRRAYSNKGSVLVRGRRAPVLGSVTMNTTMVDVTDIPGVQAGDEVVLFGRQGGEQITQAEIEAWTGVILADQYSVWGALNPKFPRTR